MAILDKPLRKVSSKLIRTFGTTVTLVRRGLPVYDIEAGRSVEAVTEYAVKAIIGDYKANELQEGLIKVGDRQVLIASKDLDFEPQASDQIVFEGIVHNIISIQQFYSGDQSALFSCQVRK